MYNTPVYGGFAGESVLRALCKTAEKTGEHFRFGAGKKVVWLRKTLPASGMRAIQGGDVVAIEGNAAVCLITNLEEVQDGYDVISRIYPFGSGNAEARLTLGPTSRTAPAGYTLDAAANYIKNDAAEAAYGRIEAYLSFKDISLVSNSSPDQQTAANMLYDAAYEYLARHKEPAKFYRLDVAALAGDLLPGQTIRVEYSRWVDGYHAIAIDANLYILEATKRIDTSGVRTVGLQVSTVDRWPATDEGELAGQMDAGKIFEAHPQMNANSYVVSYREPMDSGKAALLDFWLGTEVVTVNQVALRFRIDPLRATVKSVSATSATTTDGGGGAPTSAGGAGTQETAQSDGGLTTADGSHYHRTSVLPETPNTTAIGWYINSNLVTPVNEDETTYYFDVGVSTTHAHTIPVHTHTVTIANHTHDVTIPNHHHDVTPTINTVYGLFEESGANTLAETDLVYKVNGSADLGAGVVSLGGGWYELDITDEVIDANYRPNQATNQLEISTVTASKTALITGQLVVRTVIQATGLI